MERVAVTDCYRNNICPPEGRFCMDSRNFKSLNRNVIKLDSYSRQLEELLKTLTKENN